MSERISVIIPARDESDSIASVLSGVTEVVPDAEIIVIDDGSQDATVERASQYATRVLSIPYSIGNGGAIKTGARHAHGDILVLMDADGQHDPRDIPRLVERLESGYDMVVGARRNGSQANLGRGLANWAYNKLASYMTGHDVKDLTSGFRVAYKKIFTEFMHLLPNGFSYPTTITMAFFRAGFTVAYIPITATRRTGRSHVRPLRDGLRFLIIIFKVATLYSPLKVFIPTSAGLFCIGLAYYVYTFMTQGRFTNMSALLFTTSVIAFLIGLVSEQITQLMYKE
ncbi:glycosyltransferase family 2 protein [Arhodomonas aquaeolei]|uniref:glycosyltransferase family 2 protein n=1 Tax=Arhodomonas aquaeolei TaxID=2369 RepID=UPI002169230C|nr:glycosyltransferase family 2 protein [Arhodomonas aquaeolei]MCS4503426.1 glycosyltransferase family 2 protein [Arhodomonas aquaeolei]